MKVAIISDIHDNHPNLIKALAWCKQHQVEALFCAGDLASLDTLDILVENFSGPVYLVKGNMCYYSDNDLKNYKQVVYLGRKGGVVELGGKRIGMCHESSLIDNLIKTEQIDILFYGHSHKPWIEERGITGSKGGEVKIVNPGNLANIYYAPTFAVYDTVTDNLELKILDEI